MARRRAGIVRRLRPGRLAAVVGLCCAVCGGGSNVLVGAAAKPSPPSESVTDAFKRFVESPPPLEIVYRKKLPPVLGEPRPMDVGLSLSTNYVYRRLRWQPNAFQLREAASLTELAGEHVRGQFVARYEDTYWDFDTGGRVLVWNRTFADPGPNDISQAVDDRLSEAGEILNMGIWLLPPGSIRWEGDRFRTRAETVETVVVEGQLSVSNDLPDQLRIKIKGSSSVVNYLVRYDFDSSLAMRCVPSRIRTFQLLGTDEVEAGEIRVLQVRSPQTSFARKDIDPENLYSANGTFVAHLTNGILFRRDSSGRLVKLGEPVRPSPLASLSLRHRAVSNGVLWAALGAINLSILVLLVRAKKARTQTPTTGASP
jgi:hypothetical protein